MTLEELVKEAHGNSRDHGWWSAQTLPLDPNVLNGVLVAQTIPEKLCLVHSEVSEALEDYRNGGLAEEITKEGKPVGLPSELADIVIRVADLAGALGIDLAGAIERKLAYNRSRPYRHGGKLC